MRNSIKIPLLSHNRHNPFIKVCIDGLDEEIVAMVDTGSELTLLDVDVAKKLKDKNTFKIRSSEGFTLNSIAGKTDDDAQKTFFTVMKVQDENSINKNFMLSGILFDFSVMKASLSEASGHDNVSLILGSDFCAKYRTIINYKTNTVTFHDLFRNKRII